VVLIIGSGAGGGTLGNELAQKGIRTVILEAGPRIEREQHIERQSFAQLAWLDKRTTSGSWRIAKDSPSFPAWVCKVVGGTTVHWGGCSVRLQEHELRARDVYGNVPGANLLNWPLTPAELEPYYDRAEDKMGVTGTHGIPLLDANNNQIVMSVGARKVGYKECSTGNMAINSRSRDGRPATLQDGFCFQGIRSNAKWSTLNTEIPKGEATGTYPLQPEFKVYIGGCPARRNFVRNGACDRLTERNGEPWRRYSHWSASPQSETAQEEGTQQRKQAESVRVMPALAEADARTRITSESLPECRQAHLRRT
jgi:choline dehydrogenase-like flavoprotein